MIRSLTYVEVDVPAWTPPGPDVTFRFAIDADYLPTNIDCIPSIKSINVSPAAIGLGTDLGQRTSLTVTFRDHRHVFANEFFETGTFWGKWRARYGLTLRGRPLRLLRGKIGQPITHMEIRQYIIEASDGPNATGEYKIIAKDILKFADGDRAQAPFPSSGFLLASITNVATAATLSPVGIGNAEYAASGVVAIGGNEIALYTRIGDALTLTRGQFNTTAVAHDAGDRVQVCLDFSAGYTVSDIIAFLMVTYTDILPTMIPQDEWDAEVAAHLAVNFSALIAEPTSVNKLLSELIEQASLALWWDDIAQLIRMQVLRAVSGGVIIDMERIVAGSMEIIEQPDKRLSQVYVSFGKINPLIKEDQLDNYRSAALRVDDTAETDYGAPAIKKIYSRWIPAGGRATAELIANKHLGRYRDPPRRFSFDLMRFAEFDPQLGAGYLLKSWQLQSTLGLPVEVPIQVFRVNPAAERFEVEAEEMLWTPYGGDIAPGTRAIIFDADEPNVNVRTRHDQLYPAPTAGLTINVYVNALVNIFSWSTAVPAMDIGTWPGGVTINLIVYGRIRGRGGLGGDGGSLTPGPFASAGTPGSQGGTALYTRQAINLTTTGGQVWGGGGGGGGGGAWAASSGGFGSEVAGSGGGGGAGHANGQPGIGGIATIGFQSQTNGLVGQYSTADTPGFGGNFNYAVNSSAPGGVGGLNGQAGANGVTPTAAGLVSPGGVGGAGGYAIDGDSFVTDVGAPGSILGARVN